MSESVADKKANTVFLCFSKDRPLQLDLCLKTAKKQCQDWEELKRTVIYKASTPRYSEAYLRLEKDYPDVEFIKEGNFKTDLLCSIEDYDYIFFCVDDTIFTGKFFVKEGVAQAGLPNSLGFSLRLGQNTTFCFPNSCHNYMPYFIVSPSSNILEFSWKTAGLGDFSYPLEVSSSIYKKEKILDSLKNGRYQNPNGLEWEMYIHLFCYAESDYLSCYKYSVAFSNPINKVQDFNPVANRAGENKDYSPERLLEIFEEGKKINDAFFDGFISNGCHQLVDIEFI